MTLGYFNFFYWTHFFLSRLFCNFAEKMEKEDLLVVEDVLRDALDLISNEMECVCNDELSREYQRVIDELDRALELFKK